MYHKSSSSVVTLRQFMPLFDHFGNFSTSFDILNWNFAYVFVSMYHRSSLSVVTLRKFLKELRIFLNLQYRK